MYTGIHIKTALKLYEWFFVNLYSIDVTRGKVYTYLPGIRVCVILSTGVSFRKDCLPVELP